MAKRSIWITIFGYLNFIPGIVTLSLYFLTLLLNAITATITGKIEVITSTFISSLSGIIIGLILLLSGIGLLKLKKWGLKLFICFCIYGVIYGAYALWYKFYNPINHNEFWIVVNVISILFWFFALWLFTRKRIIEQFYKEK